MRWWTRTRRRPVGNARSGLEDTRQRLRRCTNSGLPVKAAFSRRHILRTFQKKGEKKGIKYDGRGMFFGEKALHKQ